MINALPCTYLFFKGSVCLDLVVSEVSLSASNTHHPEHTDLTSCPKVTVLTRAVHLFRSVVNTLLVFLTKNCYS